MVLDSSEEESCILTELGRKIILEWEYLMPIYASTSLNVRYIHKYRRYKLLHFKYRSGRRLPYGKVYIYVINWFCSEYSYRFFSLV